MIEGIQVIDFHGHVGREDWIGMNDDPGLMLHAMDLAGIDVACLFNVMHLDGTTGNDLAARFVAQHPDRFIGFAHVSPHMPERMVPELTRAIDELNLVAIKLYSPSTPWPLNEPPWDPIYAFADQRELTIIFHTGPDPRAHPKLLADVAPRYPRAKFVAGHAGNTPQERAQGISAAQAHPNIYLETCSTFRTPGVIEQLVNEAGADRVLYGSDQPLMDPRPQVGKIITADISDEAKRQVLGGNARRLLGIQGLSRVKSDTLLHFSPRVPVFDANVRVGDPRDQPSPCRNRAELLAELDRHGVERALIYHAHTEVLSPIGGNVHLEEWLGDDGRLSPQWSVMPTADSLAQVQALHAQGRVRSVRLHHTPRAGLPFRPWVYAPLLSWLREARIPLWIALPDIDPDDLVTTLQSYPDLVTVLVGAHYLHTLWVRPILNALPNAYLELSRYEPIGEVETLRDEIGARRLLYGSWHSRYAMGPMLFYLHHTNLSGADLALVCAGNLERILRGEGQRA